MSIVLPISCCRYNPRERAVNGGPPSPNTNALSLRPTPDRRCDRQETDHARTTNCHPLVQQRVKRVHPPSFHYTRTYRIFLCGEMSFSVARSARSILRVCRQSANDLPPSDHSLSVHSTSSPTLHLYRLHRHSSSVPAILVARYLARSRSSRPATAQVPLLIVSSHSLTTTAQIGDRLSPSTRSHSPSTW